jgi:hypothetical protein
MFFTSHQLEVEIGTWGRGPCTTFPFLQALPFPKPPSVNSANVIITISRCHSTTALPTTKFAHEPLKLPFLWSKAVIFLPNAYQAASAVVAVDDTAPAGISRLFILPSMVLL